MLCPKAHSEEADLMETSERFVMIGDPFIFIDPRAVHEALIKAVIKQEFKGLVKCPS